MTPGEWAWLALGAEILAYEVMAPEGELLSEVVDRWIEKHPVVTTAVIASVALHLANAWTVAHLDHLDPIHNIAMAARKFRRN